MKRFLSLFLVMALTAALAACGQQETPAASSSEAAPPAASQVSSESAASTAEESSEASSNKITDTPMTLTYYIPLGEKATQVVKSNAEIAVYPLIEEETGIHIDWIHPPVGDDAAIEQLNLMIASQDLPDMIFVNWIASFPGGLAKALNDNVIIDLKDMIDQHAPNFKKVIEDSDEVTKQLTLDNGAVAMFPSARPDPRVRVWYGPQIRGDWLERVGLEPPATIDEWYITLKAFKEQDANGNGDLNDEIPFVANGMNGILPLSGAFGVNRLNYMAPDGAILYSPILPAFQDYLITMRDWYAEGLIDPDFAATDGNGFTSKVTTGKAGAYYGSLAGNLGRFAEALAETEPGSSVIGLAYPSGTDGKAYQVESEHIKAIIGNGTAISTQNQHVVESVKWLDYHYGEKGHMYMNFGVEGVSYEMINGYPTYTDLIFNNPDGLTSDLALAKYALTANTAEALVQDFRMFEQWSLGAQHQRDGNALWAAGDTSLLLPPLTPSPEEASELAKLNNEINTYVREMFVKFVMGQVSIENEFDQYVENVKNMNVDRAIEIMQGTLDRYNAR